MATAKDRLHGDWFDALSEAYVAGCSAAAGTTPTPMMVYSPKNLMGSLTGGDDGGVDTSKPVYHVAGGVCGFAWVNMKGNRAFLNWLTGKTKTKYAASEALHGHVYGLRKDSYYGGVSVSADYGQSLEKKMAFTGAFARVLNERVEGLTAYSMSRMD